MESNALFCQAQTCEDFSEIEKWDDQCSNNTAGFTCYSADSSCPSIQSNAGKVAGIVIGAVAGVSVLGAALYFVVKKSGQSEYAPVS